MITMQESFTVSGPPEQAFEEALRVRVDGLRHSYDGNVVLDGVSLELQRGDVILLRGDNGSGKTTLLNILSGHIAPNSGMICLSLNGRTDTFRFPQKFWQKLNPFNHFAPERIARAGLCRTWQELRLFSTLDLRNNIAIAQPGQTGENPVASLLLRSHVEAAERDLLNASDTILSSIGLAGRERSSADMISLGQSKRVAVARAVQTGAKVLFLDEPLAGLDERGSHNVMKLLTILAQHDGITLVIVEHVLNIPRILSFATKVWTLANGKLQVEAPTAVKRVMLNAGSAAPDEFIRRVAQANSEIINEELPNGAHLTRIVPPGIGRYPPVLKVSNLVVQLGKRVVIGMPEESGNLRGFNLTLRKGEVALLRAPNGWGKTTLLRALAGLYPIVRGSIKLEGVELRALAPWKRAQLGLVTLQAQSLSFPALTVRETLRLCHIKNVCPRIEALLDREVADLSGGEKQMLSIWCALGGVKPVALLDEPFSALDDSGHKQLEILLSQRSGATLIALPGSL
jgi:ABC-type branched-subunit amino acid transport system ATPase component